MKYKDLHTIKNPLILKDESDNNSSSAFYKVNKPNQSTQKLVSLEVAEQLREALGLLIHNGYQVPSNKDMEICLKVYDDSFK